jgi:hypothetical protein
VSFAQIEWEFDFNVSVPHLPSIEELMKWVTPEEMISLLDSGIGIRDLLAFLASKSSGAA